MSSRVLHVPKNLGKPFVDELSLRCFEKPNEVIRLAEKAMDRIEPRLLPELLGPYGSALRRIHWLKEARGALRAGIRMAQCLGDLTQEASLVQRLAYVPADEGNHRGALKLSLEAANLYELSSNKSGVGQCLVDQGIWRFYLGDYERALYSNRRALEILPFSEKQHRFAAITGQAFNFQKLGDTSSGISQLQSAITLSEGLTEAMLASLHLIWGRLEEDQGELDSAAARYSMACDAFANCELYVDSALAGAHEVRIILLLGHPEKAAEKAKCLGKLIQNLHSKAAVGVLTELIRQAAATGRIHSIDQVCRVLERVRTKLRRPHLPPPETA